MRRTFYVGDDKPAQVFCCNISNVKAAHMPVTFNQRDDWFLRCIAHGNRCIEPAPRGATCPLGAWQRTNHSEGSKGHRANAMPLGVSERWFHWRSGGAVMSMRHNMPDCAVLCQVYNCWCFHRERSFQRSGGCALYRHLAANDFGTLAWILTGFLAASGVIGYYWAPSTQGKSLEQLEAERG